MQGLAVGTKVGGYIIEAELGRGGMGVVYCAQKVGLGRRVALKVIAPELAEDPKYAERFRRESRLAASVEHPNVVPVYEAGEYEELLFIAMRYVPGANLAEVVRRHGALEPSRAVRLL